MKNLKTYIKIQGNLQIDGSKQNQNKLLSVECIPSKNVERNNNDKETQEIYHSDEVSRS